MTISHDGVQLPIKTCLPIDWKNTKALWHFDISEEESLSGIKPVGNRYALGFDGTDDYVDIGDVNDMRTNDLTVEAWIKTTDTSTSTKSFVSKAYYGAKDHRYHVGLRGGKIVAFMCGVSTDGDVVIDSVKTVADGVWHHIAVTYDRDGSMSVYIDGVFDSSALISQWSSVDMNSSFPFRIGCYTLNDDNDTNLHFNGHVSEVRVWSKALSESQVKRYMYSHVSSDEDGLMGCWKLDQGEGIVANDISSNNNDGAIYGATWVDGMSVWTLREREGKFGGGIAIEEGTTNLVPESKNRLPSYGNNHGTYNTNQYNSNTNFSIGTINDVTNNIVTLATVDHPIYTYDVLNPATSGGGVTAGTQYFIKKHSSNSFSLHAYDGSQDGSKGYAVHDSVNNDVRISINATDFPTMWHGNAHQPNAGLVKEIIPNGFNHDGRVHDCIRLHTEHRLVDGGGVDDMAYGVYPQVVSGEKYTFSFYYRAVTDRTIGQNIHLTLHTSAGWVDDTHSETFVDKEWHRYEVTATAPNSGGTNMYFWVSGAGTTVDISEIQCEHKPFTTSFIDGSRSTSNFRYDSKFLSNQQEGTISFWIKPTKFNTSYNVLVRCGLWATGSHGFGILKYPESSSDKIYFEYGIPSTEVHAIATSNTLKENEWNFVAVTWSKTSISITLANSGGFDYNSKSISTNLLLDYKYPLGIGKNPYNDSYQINAIYDELRIDSVARTQAEIETWWASGSPFFPRGVHKKYLK